MIWNIIPNEERLILWKKLRDQICDLSVQEQLVEIARFCAHIPFGSRVIDYYTPMDWPTPWEILFHGMFCTSSISLLIFYTLILLPNEKTVELFLVEDDRGVYLLPVINNHFVLNYELGQISKLSHVQNNFKILQKYTKEQIKTIT